MCNPSAHIVVIFVLLLSTSFSATIYVNNSDADYSACGFPVTGQVSNYSTIQEAVESMNDYDTIIVCPSLTSYGAHLNITKPGIIKGAGNNFAKVYFNTTTLGQSYIFRLVSGNVNISNFYFMNSTNYISSATGPYGVAVSVVNSSLAVNISNNKFENFSSAIELYENSSNVYFENNTVINSSAIIPVTTHFSSIPLSNLSIFNNTILGNNSGSVTGHCFGVKCYGIYLNYVNATLIKSNNITNGTYGIYVTNSRFISNAGQIKIFDNTISRTLTGVAVSNSTQINLSRNSISTIPFAVIGGGYGVFVTDSNYTTISENNITYPVFDAFKIFNLSNSSITGNRAVFSGYTGLSGCGFFIGYINGDSDPINFVDNNVSNNYAENSSLSGFSIYKASNN